MVERSSLAPASDAGSLVCPRCGAIPVEPSSARLQRCAVHDLAFVTVRELENSKHDPLLGQTVAGRFTILGRLGHGSMGAVYRARQEAVGRDIALKIVRRDRAYDPETKVRFEREARATSALTSPHTVTAFDFGEAEDGSWFLAMELLEGESLGARIRRETRIPWDAAVRFTREALKSLSEAHSKGIIHRDLKPDNLFLAEAAPAGGEPQQVCKVLDFGIAKLVHNQDAQVDQLETQAGTVFGTPRYMSPEQAQGLALDARSDLYSLGVILYQMLIGRAPFTDDDAVVVMARHIKDPPHWFSEIAPEVKIPPALERIVRRVLSKDPKRRPQRADDFIAELDAALVELGSPPSKGQVGVQAVTVDHPKVLQSGAVLAQPRPRRKRIGALLGAAGGLLVVSLAIFSSPSDMQTRHAVSPPAAKPKDSKALAAQPIVPRIRAEPRADAGTEPAAQRDASGSARSASRDGKKRVPGDPAGSSRADNGTKLPKKPDERYGRFQ